VAENRFAQTFDLVADISGFAFVAAHAVLIAGHAEGLYAGVAGTTGFGLLHLGHGVVTTASQVEDGVMTDLAFVVVLGQVQFVAEYDRLGILEIKTDILGFHCV